MPGSHGINVGVCSARDYLHVVRTSCLGEFQANFQVLLNPCPSIAVDVIEAIAPLQHVDHPRIEPVECLADFAMALVQDGIVKNGLVMHHPISQLQRDSKGVLVRRGAAALRSGPPCQQPHRAAASEASSSSCIGPSTAERWIRHAGGHRGGTSFDRRSRAIPGNCARFVGVNPVLTRHRKAVVQPAGLLSGRHHVCNLLLRIEL